MFSNQNLKKKDTDWLFNIYILFEIEMKTFQTPIRRNKIIRCILNLLYKMKCSSC